MTQGGRQTAVLLLNMGGPDSLEAVRPFLRNLFLDPAILGLPAALRRPLAAFLSVRRTRKVRPRYELIGGKSPIGPITQGQATAVEELLGPGFGPVLPAFSYWHPFIADAVDAASRSGADSLIALSLYPQYCSATTGSCLRDVSMNLPGTPFEDSILIIDSWASHPPYLDALADTVEEALARIPVNLRDDAVILFSAHGVPESLIEGGDPYLDQTITTVDGVMERLGGREHQVAFQSRLGPVKWLQPALKDKLKELSTRGAPPLVVVPVSFVSDHIETLYELDIQHREIAMELGFTIYERSPALNTRPDFIASLADLVRSSAPARGGEGERGSMGE
ncbi:MAG: ferrochelatase [bacterium]|nr:ferrochelatase [bacterium]MDT8365742.1 ferrochelatase [bacterium]